MPGEATESESPVLNIGSKTQSSNPHDNPEQRAEIIKSLSSTRAKPEKTLSTLAEPSSLQSLTRRLKVQSSSEKSQNFHDVIQASYINEFGERRRIEFIHQLQSGDCVLANYLNTRSFEGNGLLPMTIQEARQKAIDLRKKHGEDPSSIIDPNSALSTLDVVDLFSTIYNKEVDYEQDVINIDGKGKSDRQLKEDASDILERLGKSEYGSCAIGFRGHSMTIEKLKAGNYALLDPMDPGGIQLMDSEEMMKFISTSVSNQPKESNFFFFIRK